MPVVSLSGSRYDDRYFVQNITRATDAGMLAGPYHFSRPDVIASTQNSSGIANTGADEADHFIQMAGTWMRPGYLLPVFDLESGYERTRSELAQFSIDFLFWQQQAGNGVPPLASSQSVPEPSTGIMLMLGMAAMLYRRDVIASYRATFLGNPHKRPRIKTF